MKHHHYYLGKLTFKKSVRLLLLCPVPPNDRDEGPFPLAPREYLLPTTHVDEIYCSGAPRSYESPRDGEKALPLIVAKAKWAESQGYDAVIVNCMVDPGVPQAKRAVNIPVIGLGEASLAVAGLVGKNPARVFPANIPVLELAANEEKSFHELVKAGRWQVAKRGVDVLILNCAYLGGLAQRVQAELGVPVLANVDIGLRLAELLATFGVGCERKWVRYTRASRLHRLASHVAYLLRRWLWKSSSKCTPLHI